MKIDLVFVVKDIDIGSNLKPFKYFDSNSRGNIFEDVPMELLLQGHEDHPYQEKNNRKLWDGNKYPCLYLNKSQWKRKPKHDKNFLKVGKWL